MTPWIPFQEAFKLALSMTLFYWLALWMDWDLTKYGAAAIVLVSLDTRGASLLKSAMRLIGTTAGLAVGLLALGLFAQDRWGMLIFFSAYLVLIGYVMQASRHQYAWQVAGWLPVLVWSTTYEHVDGYFHFATFRYLETSAGILIYTLIAALLWPRSAGDQLSREGDELWSGLQELFGFYRRHLKQGVLPAEAPGLQARLAGLTSQVAATLQAALVDTPTVIARKAEWERLRVDVRAMGDALELWRESTDDCRRLDLGRLLPQLESGLDSLGKRLERAGELWRSRSTGADVEDATDGALMEPLRLNINQPAATALPVFDRAALLSFVQQLELLDAKSRDLLRTLQALAGAQPDRQIDRTAPPADRDRASIWDPTRLRNALFPVVCFVAGSLFWIYTDPPAGPAIAAISASLSLAILVTPMNAPRLVPVILVVLLVAVAPVYFFVLPVLDTGFGLLTLVFLYTLLFGYVGVRSPAIKLVVLMCFVYVMDISNHQVHSFMKFLVMAQAMSLTLGIIAIVQMLVTPPRPEQTLLRSLRRFFHGCSRILDGYAPHRSGARARRLRKRHYASVVLPVPQHLRAVVKRLDFKMSPRDDAEKMDHLLNGLQSICYRLQALELAHGRADRASSDLTGSIGALLGQLRVRMEGVFDQWARFERCQTLNERAALQELSKSLEQELRTVAGDERLDQLDDQALTSVYALLGCARLDKGDGGDPGRLGPDQLGSVGGSEVLACSKSRQRIAWRCVTAAAHAWPASFSDSVAAWSVRTMCGPTPTSTTHGCRPGTRESRPTETSRSSGGRPSTIPCSTR